MMYYQEMNLFNIITNKHYLFTISNIIYEWKSLGSYVKKCIINYFDSFGMPPFQEIVNPARKENLTLLHQNNQIQNIMTTTCGYFCLYFLNEMNKGDLYYDLLKVFDIHDTMYNFFNSILKISNLYI